MYNKNSYRKVMHLITISAMLSILFTGCKEEEPTEIITNSSVSDPAVTTVSEVETTSEVSKTYFNSFGNKDAEVTFVTSLDDSVTEIEEYTSIVEVTDIDESGNVINVTDEDGNNITEVVTCIINPEESESTFTSFKVLKEARDIINGEITEEFFIESLGTYVYEVRNIENSEVYYYCYVPKDTKNSEMVYTIIHDTPWELYSREFNREFKSKYGSEWYNNINIYFCNIKGEFIADIILNRDESYTSDYVWSVKDGTKDVINWYDEKIKNNYTKKYNTDDTWYLTEMLEKSNFKLDQPNGTIFELFNKMSESVSEVVTEESVITENTIDTTLINSNITE